jgi:RNA 2',3'-cyclic 3'-phosphodiesterase
MSDGWRCFIAVPVTAQLRASLAADIARLRRTFPGLDDDWRWVEPAQWHVTLAFLGDTSPGAIDGLVTAIGRVSAVNRSFELATEGIGVFPSPRAARVLWHGIVDPGERLAGLAADVRRELGLDPAPFSPHVTVGRSRHRHGAEVNGLLRQANLAAGALRVDRAVLYRSHRGSGPARYEVLAESRFAAGPLQP